MNSNFSKVFSILFNLFFDDSKSFVFVAIKQEKYFDLFSEIGGVVNSEIESTIFGTIKFSTSSIDLDPEYNNSNLEKIE